ncbi:MAG: hypothetical protein ACK40X_03580, partial [Armatimonadota bacterium]
NLQVDIWIDSNGNGNIDQNEPITRLYGPAEPMRTFPTASRWYQGDGSQIDPNPQNPDASATWKEWGIMDIPIPLNALGSPQDVNALAFALQRLRIIVTSPVAGEVIPQGRKPVRYELAGIKLALYDESGMPRPIWQPTRSGFILAQTIHAENGTIGVVPSPYFDPTAHPSWQQLILSTQQQWIDNFRRWQRLWSLYYLRHNSVRWTPFIDSSNLPSYLISQTHPQSVPVLAGQLIMRVTPQTMLWRLARQGALGNPNDPNDPRPNALRFAWEMALDKSALPYWSDLNPNNRLADFLNLQRPVSPVFMEVPRTMFASAWLWVWRAMPPQGVLGLERILPSPPPYYRAPVVPNLNLPKGYAFILQQQVGED